MWAKAPYRIDRMLSTLRLAGKLDPLRAVVLGQFTTSRGRRYLGRDANIAEVLDDYFLPLHIPVIKGFHAGHVRDNVHSPWESWSRRRCEQSVVVTGESRAVVVLNAWTPGLTCPNLPPRNVMSEHRFEAEADREATSQLGWCEDRMGGHCRGIGGAFLCAYCCSRRHGVPGRLHDEINVSTMLNKSLWLC